MISGLTDDRRFEMRVRDGTVYGQTVDRIAVSRIPTRDVKRYCNRRLWRTRGRFSGGMLERVNGPHPRRAGEYSWRERQSVGTDVHSQQPRGESGGQLRSPCSGWADHRARSRRIVSSYARHIASDGSAATGSDTRALSTLLELIPIGLMRIANGSLCRWIPFNFRRPSPFRHRFR